MGRSTTSVAAAGLSAAFILRLTSATIAPVPPAAPPESLRGAAVRQASLATAENGTTRAELAAQIWEAQLQLQISEHERGSVTIEVHPEWAPKGAARFRELVEAGVLNDARFFRVIPGFMAQFGIPGNPMQAAKWSKNVITDDPVMQSNTRGFLSFAASGPDTRSNQMFINFGDNHGLDSQGFSPFAKVTKGMEFVDQIFSGYGEKPEQGRIEKEGNLMYLDTRFPDLSFIKSINAMGHSDPEHVEPKMPIDLHARRIHRQLLGLSTDEHQSAAENIRGVRGLVIAFTVAFGAHAFGF